MKSKDELKEIEAKHERDRRIEFYLDLLFMTAVGIWTAALIFVITL